MKLDPRLLIYSAAAAALAIGALAYGMAEEESDHDEHGILAGDTVRVAVVGAALAAVALVSLVYISRRPPDRGG